MPKLKKDEISVEERSKNNTLYLHVDSLLEAFDDDHVLLDDRGLSQGCDGNGNLSGAVQLRLVRVHLKQVEDTMSAFIG